MKYREVKKALNDIGFEITHYQTSGKLDMLSFMRKDIDSEILVDFCYNIELPPAIESGEEEFNYDTAEFLLDLPINSVSFHVDMSISYCSENVLDTYGANDMNIISLFGEDVDKYLYKVCDLLKNPDSLLDFQLDYNNEFTKFTHAIKKYTPILRKYRLDGRFEATNGGENTLYRSVIIFFGDHRLSVNFYFNVLSWKTSGYFDFGAVSEEEYKERTFSLDISTKEFEKMLKQLHSKNKEFEKKYNEYMLNEKNR